MPDKLTGHLATHVSSEAEHQVRTLAALEDKSPSEYLREVIASHLETKRRQFEGMQRAFGALSSMSSERAE